MSAPTVQLSNGKYIPILGLGTFNSGPKEVEEAVKIAIDAGYRHIDSAYAYANESGTGNAINAKITEGVVKREDLFVTNKLWNTFHDPKEVRGAIERSLEKFNLKYFDLYLVHFPISYQKSDQLIPKDSEGNALFENFDLVDTWRAMEELVDAGLTKSVGISNFNIRQIDYITANARIQPVMNQIEVHPYLLSKELIAHCRSKGINITAYCPLGSPGRPWAKPDDRILLKEPNVLAIANEYNKSPAQILLRYHVDVGNVVISGSIIKNQIIENFDIFDFKLTNDDIKKLESFQYSIRVVLPAILQDIPHKEFPFRDEL